MDEAVGFSLAGRFLRGLATGSSRPALHLPGTSMSYGQVHECALRWAGWLTARAGGRPVAVAVLADKGVEGYVGVLAAHYAGAAVVPLNPGWPATRLRQMLTAARVDAVIADSRGLRRLSEAERDDLPVLAPRTGGGTGSAIEEPVTAGPDDIAYVMFTSGSTGRPKGIPLSQRAYAHYFGLLDRWYDFHADDAFAQTVELNFDCAIFDLFCAWGAGACVHAVPAAAYRDVPAFAADRGLTVWFSTPSTIADVRRLGGLPPGSLPGLRWSFFCGEALLVTDAAAWQAAAPGGVVENLYGPAELTISISRHRFDPDRTPAQAVNGVVPIGTVHPGHEWMVVEGELCVRGPQLMSGYLDPADDEGRFIQARGLRWYRTGDLVRRIAPDVLAYLGRRDSQVQVKGRRIELAEIDHAVRGFDGVQDAVTLALPGDGSVELVVFYTGVEAAPMALAQHLLGFLPQGLVPRRYHHLEAFPLNPNRKIDRLALAAGRY